MPELSLTVELFLLLFAVGVVAGAIDAIAGGGGLIALPVLLSIGLTPVQALATNKLQGSFGTLSATVHFSRLGLIDLKSMRGQIICTFLGAMLGTDMVQYLGGDLLRQLVPLLLIFIAVYFLFSPNMQEQSRPARVSEAIFGLTAGFSLASMMVSLVQERGLFLP